MIRSLATSPDGQWAAVRNGREVSLFAGGAPPAVSRLTLDGDDVDLALVGPPTTLITVQRGDTGNRVMMYQPPYLEAVARLDLDISAKLAATTGPRFAVLSPDMMHCMVVRAVGRSLATQKLEVAGPIEFVVGLERNQLLLGLHKKLEVWDAVSGRPLLRPQFQLPPAPRVLGHAHGHLWAMRSGSEEMFVYRLSDGRPFRHHAGSPILEVISHPASPLIVIVTERGIYKLHCFAHSQSTLEGLPNIPVALAQLPVGENISLLGIGEDDSEPWRAVLSGTGAPTVIPMDPADPDRPPVVVEAARVDSAPLVDARPTALPAGAPAGPKQWRPLLAAFGAGLAGGSPEATEIPVVAVDTELGDLAHRLGLSASARRMLAALYALHLVGQPGLSIAKLATLVGDWPEALGQGDLGALALVKKTHGVVRLRRAVSDFLDGVAPRWIQIMGGGPTTPRAGAWRVSRDSRTDPEIHAALAAELGRIAIVNGALAPLASALLEARIRGATAVTTATPAERPHPWPRDAGLVLVLYGPPSSWVADVPTLA